MSTEDRAETADRVNGADRADRTEAATTAIHRKLRLTELSGLVAAVFGLIAFAYLTVPAVDSDYGWHVANGRHLLDGQLFAGVDTYSWTAAGATWIAHEWLAESLMAFLHDSLGPTANSLLAGALATMAILLTVARLRVRGFGVAIALVVGLLALLDAGTIVSVRPLVVEVFAVALLLWLIDVWRTGGIDARRFAVVVILEFLTWANTHGSFVLGLAILGATWVSLLIERDQRAQVVGFVGVGATLVTLANPFGLRLIGYVASAVTGSRLELIAEWAPPDLAASMWWSFVVALALGGLGVLGALRGLGVLGALRGLGSPRVPGGLCGLGVPGVPGGLGWFASKARRGGSGPRSAPGRVRPDDALIAVALGFAGLQHGYHAGLFGIAAAPALAAGVVVLVGRGLRFEGRRIDPEAASLAPASRRHANLSLLAIIAVFTGALVWARVGPANTDAAIRAEYPVAALPTLDALAAAWPGGLCLFNDYSWGGWLAMVRPEIPVFIDGRSEVYGDAQLARYATISAVGPGWAEAIAATGANAALIPTSGGLASALVTTAGWATRYSDGHATLLAFDTSSTVRGSGADSAPCLPR